MFSTVKKFLKPALLGVPLFLLTSFAAFGAEPLEVVTDLVILRPVGIAATAIGTGAFIVSLPVTYANGTTQQTSETLVMKPLRFTFKRPLGSWK